MEKKFFTSESVTEGHPDKICDHIADSVLDAIMAKDPMGRVACEVCVTTNFVLIMGEVTTGADIDYEKIARDTIKEIGYNDEKIGFDYKTCQVMVKLDRQSPDIAMGVDKAADDESTGAGDQGMIFGYASCETPEYMPLAASLSHKVTKELAKLRKDGTLPYLRPDGKAQVTVEYGEDGKAFRIDTVVCSTQHTSEVSQEQLRKDIKEKLLDKVLPAEMTDADTKYFINPTGQFIVGGPNGDSGLTGRKLAVDTYGGYARNGGGAISGKDCTKVDRSAAYAARYAAKNIVAAGLADTCEIQVSYAIGVAEPVSVFVDTFGTGKVSDGKLVDIIRENFDLRPVGIIKLFDLRRPIYEQTSTYGHFGRNDLDLPWEKTDKADALKKYL